MTYSVITGDIINFSQLQVSERNQVLEKLKGIFHEISLLDTGKSEFTTLYEIFRGDSFQLLVQDNLQVLKYCILIRSGLRGLFDKHIQELCDVKIAIGTGSIDYIGENLAESDGNAFRYSGRGLDNLGKKHRMTVKTDITEINRELEVEFVLLDAIIKNWSFPQSKAVFEKLLESKQGLIAKKLGITPGGLSLRLSSASWNAVEVALLRYQELLKKGII